MVRHVKEFTEDHQLWVRSNFSINIQQHVFFVLLRNNHTIAILLGAASRILLKQHVSAGRILGSSHLAFSLSV